MGFLSVGALEVLTILVIALIIFGPGRLPEMMGEAGRMLRDFRRATRELTGDFESSISDVRQTYDEIERDMRDTARELRRDTQNIANEVTTTVESATSFDDGKDRAKGGTSTRQRTARPLDQQIDPEDDEEDLSKYFPSQQGGTNQPTESPDAGTAKSDAPNRRPARGGAKVPAPKLTEVSAKAPSSNGSKRSSAAVDDLLATEDGDDLLVLGDE